MTDKFRIKKSINAFKCLRCEHEWIPRVEIKQLTGKVDKTPIICPKCKSAYWKTYSKKKMQEMKNEK